MTTKQPTSEDVPTGPDDSSTDTDTKEQGAADAPARPKPESQTPNVDQTAQILLRIQYQQLARQQQPPLSFDDVQFRAYSQNGEDGILLYIFSLIGTTNKRCVEICAGEGIQCNTANLIINHGWRGLLLDGDDSKLDVGRDFYRNCRDTALSPPKLVNAWVTPDNINDILLFNNFSGEIDLLSLDIDGNDYWLWQAIEAARPRVVILEYQSAWGPERRMTQRYIEDFNFENVEVPVGLPKAGASLAAFVALAKDKGYRLVGCERLCFNAVFIKQGVGEDCFPEISAADCFDHPMVDLRRLILDEKEHLLPDMWQEV